MQGDRPGELTSPRGASHQGTHRPRGHTRGARPWAVISVTSPGRRWSRSRWGHAAGLVPAPGWRRLWGDVGRGAQASAPRPSAQRPKVWRVRAVRHSALSRRRELLSSEAMKEFNRARVYLDENYRSQEQFTVSASRCGPPPRAGACRGPGLLPSVPSAGSWAAGVDAAHVEAGRWTAGGAREAAWGRGVGETWAWGLRAPRRGAAPCLGPLCRPACQPGLPLCSASPSRPRARL